MICSKKMTGRLNLVMRKTPLLVFGKILTRSAGVCLSSRRSKSSSDKRSVKSLDLPMGISASAFLIQKMSIAGMLEKPRKIQPREELRKRRMRPPMISKTRRIIFKAITGRLFNARFCLASRTRGFLGSKECIMP